MSTTELYFEVIVDYGGVEGDANYIAVKKGDQVRLIKKSKEWITIEKDGHIGKVPKRILVQKQNQISQIPMNLPKQTAQPSPQIMNSKKTQNGKQPIRSMNPIDKQKSQIIPPGQNQQIIQQSDNLLQSNKNPKSHSDSGSSKSKRKQKEIHDIQSIIESETINDEKKERKIRKIYNKLKKKDQDELRKIFNKDAFKLIQKYINDCSTQLEKILMDIIELIAEKEITYNNQFFSDIQSSGLIKKIEMMTKDRIKKEKKEIKYSVKTEQLIRIYIQIMNDKKHSQQMIDISAQVIEKNLNNLFNLINKLKEEYNKENEEIQQQIEREIKQSAQLIKVISLIEEKDPKSYHNIIPEQIIKIVKERIYPLIHLNCTTDLNCQQCINVPQSPAIQELKSYVFQTLADVSQYNDEFQDMLMKDNNIILHLTHLLIQFASQSQLDKKSDSQEQHNQQKSESTSSLSLITQSLDLLKRLISNNNNKICKVVINTPNALHSFCALSIYKLNIHFNKKYDLQTFKVRHSSRWCLWYIQVFDDLSAHSELINARYVGVLVIAISTASGSGEEQDREISNRLDNISDFIRCLNQGRNYNETQFPPQPLLARRSVEQIEEEGGNEEIDSQLINKKSDQNIKNSANRAKGMILNYFIEQDN